MANKYSVYTKNAMTIMEEESYKTRSSLTLTLILANVKKLIGPIFLIKKLSCDRSNPSVSVSANAIVRYRLHSYNATKSAN